MASLFQVTSSRGDTIETEHTILAVIADRHSKVIWSSGDVETPVYPRSSIKMIQAVPFALSSARQRFGLGDQHLALACGSHLGQAIHIEWIDDWLHRLGLDSQALVCGSQWPRDPEDIRKMSGRSDSRYHCCSGKHLGLLSLAVAAGYPIADYHTYPHPAQQQLIAEINRFCQVDCDSLPVGIDGCQILTYALPLQQLAIGLARFGDFSEDDERRPICAQILQAQKQHPVLMGGDDCPATRLTASTAGSCVAKNGADGVFAACCPDQGLGIAVKALAGSDKAAEVAIAHLLYRLSLLSEEPVYPVINASNQPVGLWQARFDFAESLTGR